MAATGIDRERHECFQRDDLEESYQLETTIFDERFAEE
jgi:hypothetical protein